MDDEHIKKILKAVEKREDIEKFCRPVPPEEIAENDFNLNITWYVDTFEEEDEVDIEANVEELDGINKELVKLEPEMAKDIKEPGIMQ